MMNSNKLTYISLFSSAGIGCYGFKLEGFNCIATNELIQRRLDIQKYNQKCKYESGYICGDISLDSTKEQLFSEIAKWRKNENIARVSVVIATPPCQGMSVANHKKSTTEIKRNSLVVESIKIIKQVNPKFFIFENVPAFMKTICTDIDGKDKIIAEAIKDNLSNHYSYTSKVINLKNYGACSSRQRTLVIGVAKDYADEVSPFELYPSFVVEKTLREVIGMLKPLHEFGEIDQADIYHAFRTYPEHMRRWISKLSEGQSAFDNINDCDKPHQILNGKLTINQQKNGDKYKRQFWDKTGPCIHTRNDQLASQNTVHPCDDRVFSIRELMLMMTVPKDFQWVSEEFDFLCKLPNEKKRSFLKKEELKIRQSLGEAVPTEIFRDIAEKIKMALQFTPINSAKINKIVAENNFSDQEILIDFINVNPLNLSNSALSKIAELSNTKRTQSAAYFTSKKIITEIIKSLPHTNNETVRILEPSVGVGNFVALIVKKFEDKNIILDLMDIDENSIKIIQTLIKKYNIPRTCTINYIVADFLLYDFEEKYDYVIGNPPFFKMKANNPLLFMYRSFAINKATTNICSFFLDKAQRISSYVAMVLPKFVLNTPEFARTREYFSQKAVECIIDFGEKSFSGVLIETIAILINLSAHTNQTRIISTYKNIDFVQKQSYIFDPKLPYWVIYRDKYFDEVCLKLDFNVFNVFRDRQITNSILAPKADIRVLRSRNMSDDGKKIIDIAGYDSYIAIEDAKKLAVIVFIDKGNVYLTPNMTYKPRVMRKPSGVLVNGSVAILIPKNDQPIFDRQLEYFSTDEYRSFYQTARNFQTRSLNVDACSVFFYGLLRDTKKKDPIIEKIAKDNDRESSLFGLEEVLSDVDTTDHC